MRPRLAAAMLTRSLCVTVALAALPVADGRLAAQSAGPSAEALERQVSGVARGMGALLERVRQIDQGLVEANQTEAAQEARNQKLQASLVAANQRNEVLKHQLDSSEKELSSSNSEAQASLRRAQLAEADAAAANSTALARGEKLRAERKRVAELTVELERANSTAMKMNARALKAERGLHHLKKVQKAEEQKAKSTEQELVKSLNESSAHMNWLTVRLQGALTSTNSTAKQAQGEVQELRRRNEELEHQLRTLNATEKAASAELDSLHQSLQAEQNAEKAQRLRANKLEDELRAQGPAAKVVQATREAQGMQNLLTAAREQVVELQNAVRARDAQLAAERSREADMEGALAASRAAAQRPQMPPAPEPRMASPPQVQPGRLLNPLPDLAAPPHLASALTSSLPAAKVQLPQPLPPPAKPPLPPVAVAPPMASPAGLHPGAAHLDPSHPDFFKMIRELSEVLPSGAPAHAAVAMPATLPPPSSVASQPRPGAVSAAVHTTATAKVGVPAHDQDRAASPAGFAGKLEALGHSLGGEAPAKVDNIAKLEARTASRQALITHKKVAARVTKPAAHVATAPPAAEATAIGTDSAEEDAEDEAADDELDNDSDDDDGEDAAALITNKKIAAKAAPPVTDVTPPTAKSVVKGTSDDEAEDDDAVELGSDVAPNSELDQDTDDDGEDAVALLAMDSRHSTPQ